MTLPSEDLVERLRAIALPVHDRFPRALVPKLILDAAEEITRLRSELEWYRDQSAREFRPYPGECSSSSNSTPTSNPPAEPDRAAPSGPETRVVPVEPTEAMCKAGAAQRNYFKAHIDDIWRAMLAAAPEAG